MGDHMTGANAAGAIAAALYARERTGRGQRVAVSLLRVGAYMMGWDLNTQLRFGVVGPPYDRHHAVNPIINCFRDRDGRWFWLLLLQADRHWPDLLRAIEAPWLGEDPRFKDIPSRRDHAPELVAELDRIFAQRPLSEWGPIFDRHNVWWAPVQTVAELASDPVAEQAGVFVRVESPWGELRQVATPADFSDTRVEVRRWVPELGQHTEEVLLELGYSWEAIAELKEAGAIP
jgi:crotonobetainyl-CoA:carnitine CoA-transferase CaiB-like acyl-CoA transferase